MMRGPMFSKFFWIFPLIAIGCMIIFRFFKRRGRFSRGPANFLRGNEGRDDRNYDKPVKQVSRKEAPEEFKKSGQQIMDRLDWEIRLLEKQKLEMKDRNELKKIDQEIKNKKEEYQSIVDRLSP